MIDTLNGTALILGADGFIGRHIAFGLRRAGWNVIACARRTTRLEQMGFATLNADLTDRATHDPAFWAPHLVAQDDGPVAVINAAGLLSGGEAQMRAVHVLAPEALYRARPSVAEGVLISAVGIDTAQTRFARHRRDGEAVALEHGVTVLRAGLVLGDMSYGGTSLARALAALPFVLPAVGDGAQKFNPIHATDLANVAQDCLHNPPGPGVHPIGGPETVTQIEMLSALRGWLGLPTARILRIPLWTARTVGGIGDLLRLGPVSRTSVDQLCAGVLAEPSDLPGHNPVRPRGFSDFLSARPAGTQDLWHARLYLFRPALRLVLAILWLASGMLGLILRPETFLPLIDTSAVSDTALVALARLGGIADLAIGIGLLRAWKLRVLAWLQFCLIAAYTIAFSLLSPALWLLPLGGLMKNIPLLALVAVHGILEDER